MLADAAFLLHFSRATHRYFFTGHMLETRGGKEEKNWKQKRWIKNGEKNKRRWGGRKGKNKQYFQIFLFHIIISSESCAVRCPLEARISKP